MARQASQTSQARATSLLAGVLAVLVALLYLASSLPLSSLIARVQAGHAETAAEGTGWACAKHACACKSAGQCTRHCCCKPKGKVQLPEAIAFPTPAADDLAPGERAWVPCSNPSGEAHHPLPGLAPHLFPPPSLALLPSGSRAGARDPAPRPLTRPAAPPFKVPIPSHRA